MLGTLDDDQALSLIEALVAADGERVMAGVNDAAARGVEWEALLVEMQSLLHRIAMVQLSPSALGADMARSKCGCANWREPYRPATFSSTTKRC